MNIKEIKELTREEFVKRYPFLQARGWDRKSKKDILLYEEDGSPCLEFYTDDFRGWADILLCWAEKVKSIYDKMDKEEKESWYVVEVKEKFGSLRIYTTGRTENSKIDDYTKMAEHLSYITCINCGKRTRTSNGKKAIVWSSVGSWMSYVCKGCAKKITRNDMEDYNLRESFKYYFQKDWKREEVSYYTKWKYYKGGKEETIELDSRELLEGIMER